MDIKPLPTSGAEMKARGWDQLDILLVSGDAYVDHPSFAAPFLGRILESRGYRVGIIDQPDWRTKDPFEAMGRPRLFVGVTAGNLDSMVANFTAARKRRAKDYYSPGGRGGLRPDRALIVYCNRLREAFPGIPLIIGGLEASLRRFAHYDYWSDSVRRSMLMDARADLLIYGMGELQILEIAGRLDQGEEVSFLTDIHGTCFKARRDKFGLSQGKHVEIGDYDGIQSDKALYAQAYRKVYDEQDPIRGLPVVESYGDWMVVQNPPVRPLTTPEMDRFYELPFSRNWHPKYDGQSGVPALTEIRFSVASHRGCYGACSFCALIMHQGRIIQSRSTESVVREVGEMIKHPDWKGVVSDIGGPTANFHAPSCSGQLERGCCKGKECLYPKPCSKLETDHSGYIELLRKVRAIPGVKRVFVRSGVRYDYAMLDKSGLFLKELCEHHVSGQLKVAPEHIAPGVLKRMKKPSRQVYESFVKAYADTNKALKKEQYLVPYMISGHPGSTVADMIELAEFIRDMSHFPEQVQEFTPTPMTAATCMYHTGIDPFTGEQVHVAKDADERRMQRALLQYNKPEFHKDVLDALRSAGREDLIGRGPKCLVPLTSITGPDERGVQGRKSPGRRIGTRR